MIILLVAIGGFAVGFGGTGAYLAVSQALAGETPAGPDQAGASTTPAVVTTSDGGQPCPAFTIEAVRESGGPGDLVEVRWVQGTRPSGLGGEAWICLDSDGTLYYQGHDLNGPATAGTSNNTILIGGSVRGEVTRDGENYVATNGGTQYLVGPGTFAVVNDGRREDFTGLEQRP
jgi:hypothetical protein